MAYTCIVVRDDAVVVELKYILSYQSRDLCWNAASDHPVHQLRRPSPDSLMEPCHKRRTKLISHFKRTHTTHQTLDWMRLPNNCFCHWDCSQLLLCGYLPPRNLNFNKNESQGMKYLVPSYWLGATNDIILWLHWESFLFVTRSYMHSIKLMLRAHDIIRWVRRSPLSQTRPLQAKSVCVFRSYAVLKFSRLPSLTTTTSDLALCLLVYRWAIILHNQQTTSLVIQLCFLYRTKGFSLSFSLEYPLLLHGSWKRGLISLEEVSFESERKLPDSANYVMCS